MGSVKGSVESGTVSTLAPEDSRSAANAVCHPDGTFATGLAGSGLGISEKTAITPAARTIPARPVGRRAVRRCHSARPNASTAAATRSAKIEKRSLRADPTTGAAWTQYQGNLIVGYGCPPTSRVPPSENTDSTRCVTPAIRIASTRQNSTVNTSRAMSGGQPRYSTRLPWCPAANAALPEVCSG
jgi:hypothetical protein